MTETKKIIVCFERAKGGSPQFLYSVLGGGELQSTDKETDESWDIHINNMKNQFWAVGWAGL